jgi:hypothetical protein
MHSLVSLLKLSFELPRLALGGAGTFRIVSHLRPFGLYICLWQVKARDPLLLAFTARKRN